MGKMIGKVLATEKNPSTMEEFYFWTKPKLILNPFDVVKVNHVNNSVTYGVIEEISHITDTANFLADYISNDFGEVSSQPITHRIGMNYVKARIIGNSENVYIPVLNGEGVYIAQKEEVADALGLSSIRNPIPCGYLEMYKGADEAERVKLSVNVDSRYLIGPEGAHLNISGTEDEKAIINPIIEQNDFHRIEEKTSNPRILAVLKYYTITREDAEKGLAAQ